MAETPTILVADSSDDRRRDLGLALYEGGYEVINAVNGEEAIRFTAGLNPTLVIAHTGLDGVGPLNLYERVKATGLDVPPFLILYDDPAAIPEEIPEKDVYFLSSAELAPAKLLLQVRLLLLAREVGGELSDSIDVLYGDLTRIDIGDLLGVLQKFVISGHVLFSIGPEAGIWLKDGAVIASHWSGIRGRKAFNRVASLRGGSFVLNLESFDGDREIDVDLATLVNDAVEEKLELDELFRALPSLNSHVLLKMGEDFFSTEFTGIERQVLTAVEGAKNLADLIDRVPAQDLAAVQAIASLHERGILKIEELERHTYIVTDSTSDLLPSFARRHHITVVPLSVLFGSQVFKDGVDLQPDQFYRRLVQENKLPTTSPPSIGEFKETYSRLVGNGDIVSIHISQKLSDTPKRARDAVTQGREEFEKLREATGVGGKPVIHVVDSLQTTMGLGMMVILAERMAERGLTASEIVSRLEDHRKRYHLLFSVDTLEYLQKGGRIGKAQAMLGTLLGIKPILGLLNGEVGPVDKVRGGRNVIPKLISLFKQRVDPKRPVIVGVAHASAPKWGGKLKDAIAKNFKVVEFMESEIGPIVGTHVGPGTVGACMFQPTPEELEILGPEEQ
ncbi:MAG: DegV family EDD domain-containing protein [Acidobacteria bacterium]|nr:DegV family EDD domain-containing protein [Acidobacteriota bacterium]